MRHAPAPRRPLPQRLRLEWLGLTCLLAALAVLISLAARAPGVREINQQTYDLSMQLTPRPPASDAIVLVIIDDASLEALGYWPWRRAVHAALLPHLRQARVVGLDILLADPSPAGGTDDAVLAAALRDHGRVVLAQAIGPDGSLIQPLPLLAQAAAALGRIDVQPDADGHVRSVTLLRTPPRGGAPVPHLSVSLTQRTPRVRPDTPSRLQFSDARRTYARYPYSAVLRGAVPASAFKDKIVLVGAWATGLGDQLATPMRGLMPGVEVLAQATQDLEQNTWITIAPPWLTALASLMIVLAVCLGLRRLSSRWGLAGALAAFLCCVLLDAGLLATARVWLPPAGALVAVMLAYPLWSWRSQEAALQHIDRELERLNLTTHAAAPGDAPWTGTNTLSTRVLRLHRAVSHLKAAARDQKETLGFISHDMRSPQNAILATIDLRRQNPRDWPEADVLAQIQRQAQSTLHLVDAFVQLSRAESAPLQKHPCLLGDLIQDCCDRRWSQATQKRITLTCTGQNQEADILADTELIRRAVGNLLDNAILYTPAGGAVCCALEQEAHTWRIRVTDTGPGIAPEHIGQLFVRFHRLPGGADKPGGSGLGLAFVRVVAERHQGWASCDSRPGHGAQFSIVLPAEPRAPA